MLKYPLDFWIIMTVCFVNSMAQMITVFISLSLHTHNVSVAEIGVLISSFGLGGVIGGFLGGVLSDYLSPMTISRLSSLMNTMLIISFLFVINCHLWVIGIDLFLMGVFNSLFRPASLLLILFFDNIGKPSIVMSYRRVFVNLGVSIGVICSGFLYSFNENLVYIFCSLMVFFSFVALLYPKIEQQHKQFARIDNAVLRHGSSNYKLYFAMMLLLLGLLIYNQQQTVYGIYLNDYLHINSTKLSMLFAINGILVVLCQIPLTHVVRNISPFILSAIGSCLFGVGFGIILFGHGYIVALISVLLWSFGELLLFPSTFDIMLKFSKKQSGTNMGIYQTTFSIASLLGPSLGAFLYGVNTHLIWWSCFALGGVASLGFLFFYRNK